MKKPKAMFDIISINVNWFQRDDETKMKKTTQKEWGGENQLPGPPLQDQ